MLKKLKDLFLKEEGQALTEYALIIGLVSVMLVAALGLLTGGIKDAFGDIIEAITGTRPAGL